MFNLFKSIYDGIPSKVESMSVKTAVNNQRDSYKKSIIDGFEIEDRVLSGTDTYKKLERALRGKEGYRGKPYDYLVSVAEKRVKNQDGLIEAIETVFENKVFKDAITFERINIITYISCADWFLDFAMQAINLMVSEVAYKNHDNPYKNPVDKMAQQLVHNEGNLKTLASIANLLNSDIVDAMEKAKKLEGVTFDPDDMKKQIDQFGASAVDAMKVGFIPLAINPGYWLGQLYNQWYDYRHKEIKEDIAMLKMKIYRLERLKSGVPEDSDEIRQIDDQIEYNASRLAVLKEKLEDIENDA